MMLFSTEYLQLIDLELVNINRYEDYLYVKKQF